MDDNEFAKRLADDVNFNGQMQEEFWNVHARREDFLTKQTREKGLEIRTDLSRKYSGDAVLPEASVRRA